MEALFTIKAASEDAPSPGCCLEHTGQYNEVRIIVGGSTATVRTSELIAALQAIGCLPYGYEKGLGALAQGLMNSKAYADGYATKG